MNNFRLYFIFVLFKNYYTKNKSVILLLFSLFFCPSPFCSNYLQANFHRSSSKDKKKTLKWRRKKCDNFGDYNEVLLNSEFYGYSLLYILIIIVLLLKPFNLIGFILMALLYSWFTDQLMESTTQITTLIFITI